MGYEYFYASKLFTKITSSNVIASITLKQKCNEMKEVTYQLINFFVGYFILYYVLKINCLLKIKDIREHIVISVA